MTHPSDASKPNAWVIAARPHTLPAAVAPVLVGSGLAVHDSVFAPLPAAAALVGAGLIQIGTNFANDYYDAQKGADTDARDGFTRVTQAGLIQPTRMKHAAYWTFALACAVGLYLVMIGGAPILIAGLASITAGLLYTGGPYPYGYYGLGDVFVFVFFGLIAVTGTYYVQAVAPLNRFPMWIPPGSVTREAGIASLSMAALITDLLVINNVRDIETDRATGKRTLAVLIGYTGSRVQYIGLLGLAYIVPLWFLSHGFSIIVCLPILTLPIAVNLTRTMLTATSGDALNPALERHGKLIAGYALLFAIGLAVSVSG